MEDETPLPAEPSTTLKTVTDFWSTVKSTTEDLSPAVEQAVLSHFVDIEISKRTKRTVAAMEALKLIDADLRKKPDTITYDGAGKEIAVYSKTQHEGRQKLKQRADAIHAALSDVFNRGNFEKLNKLKIDASGKEEEGEDAAA